MWLETLCICCFGLVSASAAVSDGLSQVGCYSHVRGGHLLSGHSQILSQNTPSKCKALCFQKGFLYSGVGYGNECFCGDEHPRMVSLNSDVQCSIKCPGDSTLKCGGIGHVNVYDTGITNLPMLGMKLGCYDDEDPRILEDFKVDLVDTNTPRRCGNLCRSLGYHFAGTEYGMECFCGNAVITNSSRDTSDGECNKNCPGDEFSSCGANWRIMIYRTGLSEPEPIASKLGCFTFTGPSPLTSYGQQMGEAVSVQDCANLCFLKGYPYSTVTDRTRCWCGDARPDKLLSTDDHNCAGTEDGITHVDTDSFATVYRTKYTVPQILPKENYIGCFHNNKTRSLGGFIKKFDKKLTPEKCLFFCFEKGYLYTATKKKDECHCGDDSPMETLVKVANEECSLPCPGDRFQRCGGWDHLSVYSTGIPDVPEMGKQVGCFVDEGWPRVLQGHKVDFDTTNSPRRCLNYCAALGYNFAGVEYQKECFCGNSRPPSTLNTPDHNCDSVCSGDSTQTCGGGWRMAVYRTTDNPNPGNQGKETESSSTTECPKSESVINGKSVCRGAVVFQDSFRTPSIGKQWKHEIRIAEAPDFEFVTFTADSENSFQRDGHLVIKPTFPPDSEVEHGFMSLNGCTGLVGTRECELAAFSYNILPPVHSARLHTRRSFSMRYGIIEIRARLPAGDWLVPELWLLPKYQSYGKNYLSGKIRVAMSRGNEYLNHGSRDLGASVLQSGVLVGTEENVASRSVDNIMAGSWYSVAHNYTLVWTPDNLVFQVDGQSPQALLPPNIRLTELLGLHDTDNLAWGAGSRISPFDTEFYLSLGLSVGGMRDFPDGSFSKGSPKPWSNFKLKAMLNFWQDRATWKSSWDTEKACLLIENVKVTAL